MMAPACRNRHFEMIRAVTAIVLLLLTAEVRSETVDVKYRGPVDLKTFECRDINHSSFIQRSVSTNRNPT
jgi:hypothetical protein